MKRIVFTGDCLRNNAGEPLQWPNVRWLADLLGPKLRLLTGLHSVCELPAPKGCFDALGLEATNSAWQALFWSPAPTPLRAHLEPVFADSLVVGIELPPVLEDVLDRLGVPWIEVGVSALRFLPDFALSFRFSPGLHAPDAFALSDAAIRTAVTRVREVHPPASLPGTVFFAQTPDDRTLITPDGRFFEIAEQQLGQIPRPWVVKPHPLAPHNPVVHMLVARGASLCQDNTYAILAGENQIATISSSVAVEALHFGHVPVVFNPAVLARNLAGLTTLDGYLCSAFWREALASLGLTDANFHERFEPNRLRSGLHPFGLDPAVWPRHD